MFSETSIDDWFPLSKFYYADEALNTVAVELDSFNGRRNPQRCQQLVTKLRSCQDRVLQIIEEILSEVFPNDADRAPRDYRVKFPDDILHENFPGQLWFGAECLAAGSNIIDREFESDAIRPLAKSLTSQLDRLREMLKEQSLRNPCFYPEKVLHLIYVSALVPVKSVKEYDMLLDVYVLAKKRGYITEEQIEIFDPSIMFTLPRLAIIRQVTKEWRRMRLHLLIFSGLLIYPDGPLNVDKPLSELFEMFRPFKLLLQRIRELLRTLSEDELSVLENVLSSQNEPDFKESEVTLMSDYRARLEQKKLLKNIDVGSETLVQSDGSTSAYPEKYENETSSVVAAKERDTLSGDCSTVSDQPNSPDTLDETFHDDDGSNTSSPETPAAAESSSDLFMRISMSSCDAYQRDVAAVPDIEITYSDITSNRNNCKRVRKNACEAWNKHESDYSNCFARSKILRSRFKSFNDLIHRLFVCIAGIADQWQSTYPSDLRAILKMIFHPCESFQIYEVSIFKQCSIQAMCMI
ncbi:unnamed protein product [Soboliphyme baturini]|uniref:Uncharacterized protein n=1 Tax=Soboliphyme baturini TaxID=241478 RepID=A0A3P8F4G8_9BILA|nr:unnamed protein product [Soboliphyme baturini]